MQPVFGEECPRYGQNNGYILSHVPEGTRYLFRHSCVKRATIRRQPADLDLGTGFQSHLIGRIAGLDDKLIITGHAQSGSENVKLEFV